MLQRISREKLKSLLSYSENDMLFILQAYLQKSFYILL